LGSLKDFTTPTNNDANSSKAASKKSGAGGALFGALAGSKIRTKKQKVEK
jgi:hypothetical protein